MGDHADRYGFLTKALHWTVFLLILNQFVVATAMLNTPEGETTWGFSQGTLYNWHKSVGLIALAVALLRYIWRKAASLPDWAPNLSAWEKRAIHRIEQVLYVCMFAMPISGFVFVMAGDYGVEFFGLWTLPRVIGTDESIAKIAEWTHGITAALLTAALFAHWGVGIRHQWRHRDRYLHRMLPFTHQK